MLCSKCKEGYYENNGRCVHCFPVEYQGFIVIIIYFLFLAVFYIFSNYNTIPILFIFSFGSNGLTGLKKKIKLN